MGKKNKTKAKLPASRFHLLSTTVINPQIDHCIPDLTPEINNEPEGEYELSEEAQEAAIEFQKVTDGMNSIFGRLSRQVETLKRENEKYKALHRCEGRRDFSPKGEDIRVGEQAARTRTGPPSSGEEIQHLKISIRAEFAKCRKLCCPEEENKKLVEENKDLQERLDEAEGHGINKDVDIERLQYWLEERGAATKQATCDYLYRKTLRSTSDLCGRLEKENEILVARLVEIQAEIGNSGRIWEKNSMESETNISNESSSDTKKRLSKAAKKNKNLLAKKEELGKQIACLEGQIRDLKTKEEQTEPLVKIGAAIRMRYMELEKVDRLGVSGRLDRWVIEAGNNAAHAENGVADWAVLHARFGSVADFGEVFHTIYTLDCKTYKASRYCLSLKLHDEIHALNGGTHNECVTVEGDSKSAVMINRLEAVTNEILATDVRGHEWTPKDWVPPEERDYQITVRYNGGKALSGNVVWCIDYHYEEDVPSKLGPEIPTLKKMEILCRDSVFVDL
ncbi:uncharacterized protein PAC_02947 [Phialocephala subalpina]|uniref:Uncharacterized protein n=1 Tax=Phialocephala subalpina TaxID=576137 RepID=A0A1L7WJX3_9HELO|nr:uncharacterized protein PAC_02947 [Phialocephala subalpina]